MNTQTVLKDLVKKNCLEKTSDNGVKLDGQIRNKHYLTCNKIWNEFNMENKGDYHNHYLKKVVLLLADVSKKFIGTCLKFCKLDPCHYFSSPGLSWNTMLKMTGVKLENFFEIDIYLLIEKGLTGRICYIAKRYSKTKNKYVKNYDLANLSIYIPYYDINNLYG